MGAPNSTPKPAAIKAETGSMIQNDMVKCTRSPLGCGMRDALHQFQPGERLPERSPVRHDLERGQDAVCVCTDGEERRVAKVEQAGEADDNVQAQRQGGISRCVRGRVDVGVVVVQQWKGDGAHGDQQGEDLLATRQRDACN